MDPRKTTATEPREDLDDERDYRVTILRSVDVGRVTLRRNSRPILKGRVIKTIRSYVDGIVPVGE